MAEQRHKTRAGLSYLHAGAGRPVLLIHGVGLCAESWGTQIAHLKTHYSVFAIDLPGHGHSEPCDHDNPKIDDYAARIAEFIAQDIKTPAIIIGHSLGALIALQISANNVDMCAKAVAISTVFGRKRSALEAVQKRAQFIRDNPGGDLAAGPVMRWFGENPDDSASAHAEACRRWLGNVSHMGYAKAYAAFAATSGVGALQARSFHMPILFLTGEVDKNSTPAMSEALSELAPHGETAIIKEAGHMVQLSHSDAVNAALDAFLKTDQD